MRRLRVGGSGGMLKVILSIFTDFTSALEIITSCFHTRQLEKEHLIEATPNEL